VGIAAESCSGAGQRHVSAALELAGTGTCTRWVERALSSARPGSGHGAAARGWKSSSGGCLDRLLGASCTVGFAWSSTPASACVVRAVPGGSAGAPGVPVSLPQLRTEHILAARLTELAGPWTAVSSVVAVHRRIRRPAVLEEADGTAQPFRIGLWCDLRCSERTQLTFRRCSMTWLSRPPHGVLSPLSPLSRDLRAAPGWVLADRARGLRGPRAAARGGPLDPLRRDSNQAIAEALCRIRPACGHRGGGPPIPARPARVDDSPGRPRSGCKAALAPRLADSAPLPVLPDAGIPFPPVRRRGPTSACTTAPTWR